MTSQDRVIAAQEAAEARPVGQLGWVRLSGGVRRGERLLIVAGLVPALLFYLLFRYYAVARTLFVSLTDAQLLAPDFTFIGFRNFEGLLSDPLFLKVLWNTTYYALASTVATTSLALILAFIFEPIGRGGSLLRLIYFLPTITSAIAVATIWLWLYQPRFGLFNQVLSLAGIKPISWLTSVEWAMPSLIIMSVWGGVGFSALIFIAGLKGIPSEFAEAAIIDGASPFQVIRFIKLPLLGRPITFVLVTGIIGSFQVFQQVFLMTRGGPLDSTQVLALHIYQYAFHRLQIGQAAAMSFVLLVVVGLLTIMQLQSQRRDWEL